MGLLQALHLIWLRKFVCGALLPRGRRAAPTPIRNGFSSRLDTTIKLMSPLPLSTVALPALSASRPFHRRAIFPSYPCRPQGAPLLPLTAPPQPLIGWANYLFSDTSITTLVRVRSYPDLYRCGGLLYLSSLSGLAASPFWSMDGHAEIYGTRHHEQAVRICLFRDHILVLQPKSSAIRLLETTYRLNWKVKVGWIRRTCHDRRSCLRYSLSCLPS